MFLGSVLGALFAPFGRHRVPTVSFLGTQRGPKSVKKTYLLQEWGKLIWISKYHTNLRVRPLRKALETVQNSVKNGDAFNSSFVTAKVRQLGVQTLPCVLFGSILGSLGTLEIGN